jgi:hypothetical protein
MEMKLHKSIINKKLKIKRDNKRNKHNKKKDSPSAITNKKSPKSPTTNQKTTKNPNVNIANLKTSINMVNKETMSLTRKLQNERQAFNSRVFQRLKAQKRNKRKQLKRLKTLPTEL